MVWWCQGSMSMWCTILFWISWCQVSWFSGNQLEYKWFSVKSVLIFESSHWWGLQRIAERYYQRCCIVGNGHFLSWFCCNSIYCTWGLKNRKVCVPVNQSLVILTEITIMRIFGMFIFYLLSVEFIGMAL